MDDEGIITINPIQDDPDYCLKPNADIIVATIYYDPSVDQNNIVLNNYFDASFLAPEANGVKNDKPMTLKGNEQYYLNVDMKNFEFRSKTYVKNFNFIIGNIKSASSLILRNICQGSELFINGVALAPMSITLGSYSMLMFDLPNSVPVEDVKN
ncbi:MAG: hypothetical protein MJ200_04425 [Mycoplasmoidaceae bacterium]|nr:hypothetical protein [Mycoplasmoidaceae bacterium]